MRYKVNIQNPNNFENIPNQFLIQRYVNTTLEDLKDSAELTIRIVTIDEIQTINKQFRQKDKPTNVLSFPFELPSSVQQTLDYPFLGDIIICHQVVCQEAQEQNKTSEAHYAHLIVHGILHLLGYDHIEEQDAEIMEPLEINLLSKLGFDNPYEPIDDPNHS
jgi:probable rRNA maturation factor